MTPDNSELEKEIDEVLHELVATFITEPSIKPRDKALAKILALIHTETQRAVEERIENFDLNHWHLTAPVPDDPREAIQKAYLKGATDILATINQSKEN